MFLQNPARQSPPVAWPGAAPGAGAGGCGPAALKHISNTTETYHRTNEM